MFRGKEEPWDLSFAGCGFLGMYHIGVASCLMERAPELVHGAANIYGTSAGAMTAVVLASRASLAQSCQEVIWLAQEARSRNLGPFHPSFNLMKVIRAGLQRNLPEDAHTLCSGRLRVSLTRVSDGKNVLVSQFSSKEDLIQAIICSCFIPVYCGLFPPTFRGVRYVDGCMTDNLPQAGEKNTISVSPFSGESDICPRDPNPNPSSVFQEIRSTNTSIQMSLSNMQRLSRVFFPPEPQVLAEICQNGYKDAMRFLQENNLLRGDWPSAGPALVMDTPPQCCSCSGQKSSVKQGCLDEERVGHLPAHIKKVFCAACREKKGLYRKVSDLLPLRMASFMLMPYTLPIQSAYSAAQRFVEWIPEVPADVSWLGCSLFDVAGAAYRQAWRGTEAGRSPSAPQPQPLMEQDGHLSISSTDLHGYGWNLTDSPCPPSTPSLSTRQVA